MKNKGSILVLSVIIISLVIITGTSVLLIASTYYHIKVSNSEIKRAFYESEEGINLSFVLAYDLIREAIKDSFKKADDYLIINPEDKVGAEIIYIENYKKFIIVNLESKLDILDNPYVNITNKPLIFKDRYLTVSIESVYISENNVGKIIGSDLIIEIPEYDNVNRDTDDYSNLLYLCRWKVIK